jgi:type-F conjugative transfer system secretin TraK
MRQLLNLFKHVSLLFIFFSFPLWAAQVLVMKEQERLEAQVSAKDLNRLQVMSERIASVFGAKGTFALEQEEVKGQVFLKIHDSAPPKMDLSIITESGLTQDLTLHIKSIPGQTILLKPSPKAPTSDLWGSVTRFSSESVDLIKAMATTQEDSGYQRQRLLKPLNLWRDVDVILVEIWTGEGLEGHVYLIKNSGLHEKILHEQHFRVSPNVRAVALQARRLKPGAVLKVYVVAGHA